jgi:hypothetical protein
MTDKTALLLSRIAGLSSVWRYRTFFVPFLAFRVPDLRHLGEACALLAHFTSLFACRLRRLQCIGLSMYMRISVVAKRIGLAGFKGQTDKACQCTYRGYATWCIHAF